MAVTDFTNGYTLAAAGDSVTLSDRAVLKIHVEKVASTGTVTITDGTTTIFVTESLAAAATSTIDLPLGFKPRVVVFSAVSVGTATVRVFCEEPVPGGSQPAV